MTDNYYKGKGKRGYV